MPERWNSSSRPIPIRLTMCSTQRPGTRCIGTRTARAPIGTGSMPWPFGRLGTRRIGRAAGAQPAARRRVAGSSITNLRSIAPNGTFG